jgi:hypothetical protein
MTKYLIISSYIRKPYLILIYDFVTDPFWISVYRRQFFLVFNSVETHFLEAWTSFWDLQGPTMSPLDPRLCDLRTPNHYPTLSDRMLINRQGFSTWYTYFGYQNGLNNNIDTKAFVCFTLKFTNQLRYWLCEKTCSKIQCTLYSRNIALTTDFIDKVF